MAPSHVLTITYKELAWSSEKGLDPTIQEHRQYLRQFLDNFCDAMMTSVDSAAKRLSLEADAVVDEAAQHLSFALVRAKQFKSTRSTENINQTAIAFLSAGPEG